MAHFGFFSRLLVIAIGETAFAQPSLNTFLGKWVQAVQDKDSVAYQALIHPASKACLVGEKRDFMSRHIQTRLSTSLEVAPIIRLTPLTHDEMTSELFSYAVQPTHVAAIKIGPQTIAVGVAQMKNQWLEVLPCPNSGGLKQLRLQWGLADRLSPLAVMHFFPK